MIHRLILAMGQSIKAIVVAYLIVVIAAALLFNIAEVKFTLIDSLWWAFTTVTTTGYGDMYPVTRCGRLIGVVLMHFGSGFAFPMATALMSAKLIVNSDAFTHDEQEGLKVGLREANEKIDRLLEHYRWHDDGK